MKEKNSGLKKRYDELVKLVNKYNKQYHEDNHSDISDYDFDMLNKELREMEKAHPGLASGDSPTKKVGGSPKREAGVTVQHNVPMLSIQDVFSKEEVTAWMDGVRAKHPDAKFSVEHKIDGLSMSLRYANGRLQLAETRGTGYQGEDVTLNSLVIPDVKRELQIPYEYIEIRGEVYMTHEDFKRYNDNQDKQGKKPAANPRNLAAGTLRQLDPSITQERGLRMFIFNVQAVESKNGDGMEYMRSQTKSLDYLKSKGVAVVPHKLCVTNEEVMAEIGRIGDSRGEYDYDIDGAVVKIDQIEYRKDFPVGTKYSAGHIAYKYPPEEKEIEIAKIELSVGRTGRVAPTAVFPPVRLCGTTVQRVTLHNQDYINEKQVGIGGRYLLYKSGEIIPKLKSVIKQPEEIYKIPDRCPVCNQPVVREEDTADVKCVNPLCPSQLKRTISYFVSRNAMDIKAFGETYVDTLVDLGYIKNYADIYRLKDYREELIEKGVLGKEKNTDRILGAIEESRKNDAVKLLTALGINNVGRSTARDIMSRFDGIEELSQASYDTLVGIENVGPTTAESIVNFFSNDENKNIMKQLADAGVNMKMDNGTANKRKLYGKTFCITGTLDSMGRKEAEALIEKSGGTVVGVSKKLQYLVAGEGAGAKLAKARSLGVTVITEKDLQAMLEE